MSCWSASAQLVPHEHLPVVGVSLNGQQPLVPVHVDPSLPSLHLTPTQVYCPDGGDGLGPSPATQVSTSMNLSNVFAVMALMADAQASAAASDSETAWQPPLLSDEMNEGTQPSVQPVPDEAQAPPEHVLQQRPGGAQSSPFSVVCTTHLPRWSGSNALHS